MNTNSITQFQKINNLCRKESYNEGSYMEYLKKKCDFFSSETYNKKTTKVTKIQNKIY